MPTEAETCRKLVIPKLVAAGWEDEPHSIAEQRSITDGRIVPVGNGFIRRAPKRVDYLLRYTRDFAIAVVEAKASYKAAEDGLQQAKEYAEMLGLKFAYATNGHEIIEFDYFKGLETRLAEFPSPAELWRRYRKGNSVPDHPEADQLLTPSNHSAGKQERYYQQIAINRAVEAILKGKQRLLITMATGTGKARDEDAGRCGSHRFITCRPREGVCTSEFLCFYFLTPDGLKQLGRASPGGAGRNRTLGLTALAEIDVPVPSFTQQKWFDTIQAEVEGLKRLQAESSAQLDGLLPSVLERAFRGDI